MDTPSLYHCFICHSSDDKIEFVKPLAFKLKTLGYSVWYDEYVLKLGDSLRQKIDDGLSRCEHGIVVLSPSFFSKNWTQYELDGLSQASMANPQKKIIPIWHKVTREDVARYSLHLADKVASVTTLPLETICQQISEVLGPPHFSKEMDATRAAHNKLGHGLFALIQNFIPEPQVDEEICPRCGQRGEVYGFEGSDGDSASWFECAHCGFTEGYQ